MVQVGFGSPWPQCFPYSVFQPVDVNAAEGQILIGSHNTTFMAFGGDKVTSKRVIACANAPVDTLIGVPRYQDP